MLTLHEAVKSGRLREFVRQEESRGIGKIALCKMNAGIAALIREREAQAASAPSACGPQETRLARDPRDTV
ncbi:MAG: hypothetical protein U1E28_05595 [Beijerinckiaceae bacterium]